MRASPPNAMRRTVSFGREIVLRGDLAGRPSSPRASLVAACPCCSPRGRSRSIRRPGSSGAGTCPAHGLTTADGPSWKPLPLLVHDAARRLLGDVAPALWMIVARTGALLALAGAWRLGRMLGGRAAAVGAVGVTALASVVGVQRGAGRTPRGGWRPLVLWAIVAHLERRRRGSRSSLLTAAGLLRPEIWPFLLGSRGGGRGGSERAALVAGGAVVLVSPGSGPDVVWWRGRDERGGRRAGDPEPGERRPQRASRSLRCSRTRCTASGSPPPAAAVRGVARAGGAVARRCSRVALRRPRRAGDGRRLRRQPALPRARDRAARGARRGRRGSGFRGRGSAVAALLALTLVAHAGDLRTAARDVGQRDDVRTGLDEAIARLGWCRAPAVLRAGAHRVRHARARRAARRRAAARDRGTGPGTRARRCCRRRRRRSRTSRPVPSRGPAGQRLVVRAGGWSVWSSCR